MEAKPFRLYGRKANDNGSAHTGAKVGVASLDSDEGADIWGAQAPDLSSGVGGSAGPMPLVLATTPSSSLGAPDRKRPRTLDDTVITPALAAPPRITPGVSHLRDATANSRRRGVLPPAATGPQQRYLDFGQRFVDNRTCPECGMVYGHGLAADDAAHLKWCKSVRATRSSIIEVPSWASEPALATVSLPRNSTSVASHRGSSSSAVVPDIRTLFSAARDAELPGSAAASVSVDPDASLKDVSCVSVAEAAPSSRRAPSRSQTTYRILSLGVDTLREPLRREVSSLLDAELGEASCPMRRRRQGVEPSFADIVSFVAVAAPTGRVAGVLVTERVESAFRVRLPLGELAGISFAEQQPSSNEHMSPSTRSSGTDVPGAHVMATDGSQVKSASHAAVPAAAEESVLGLSSAAAASFSGAALLHGGYTAGSRVCGVVPAAPTAAQAAVPAPFSVPRALSDVVDLTSPVRASLGVAQV
jgi:hypothetical protein